MYIIRLRAWSIILAALVMLFTGGRSLAAGGISIAPTRIVMDGNSRIATIYLSNKGDQAATFRVMLRDKHMLESGQIVQLPEGESEINSATPFIRYSPRKVLIPAHGNQTIRLKMRNPSDGALPRGEYRTHLVFQSIPEPKTPTSDQNIQTMAIIETAIPIIVRRLGPEAEIALSEAWIDTTNIADKGPTLNIDLIRGGERSVYGDLSVFARNRSGDLDEIGLVSGLAVYYPTGRRQLSIPLKASADLLAAATELLIGYTETEAGHGDLETRLVLPLDEDAYRQR